MTHFFDDDTKDPMDAPEEGDDVPTAPTNPSTDPMHEEPKG